MTNALAKRHLAMVIALGITVWLAVQADDRNNDSIIQLAHSHQEAADRAKTTGASTALTLASDPASPGASNALNWKALAGRTPSVDSEAAQSCRFIQIARLVRSLQSAGAACAASPSRRAKSAIFLSGEAGEHP